MKTIALSVGILLLVSGMSGAADQAIRGSVLTVKNPTGANAKRKIVGTAKETSSPNTLVGDPTVAGSAGGALLELQLNGTAPSTQTFALAQGTNASGKPFWTATGTTGFQYKDPRGEHGPVKQLLIKRQPNGVFQVKAVIDGRNGAIDVVPPNPGTDACVALQLGGGDRYSVQFGSDSAVHNGGTKLFKASKPQSEGICPGPVSSTTTTTVTTSTTNTSEPSTTSTSVTSTSSTTNTTELSTTSTSVTSTTSTSESTTTTSTTSTTTTTESTTTSSTTSSSSTTTTTESTTTTSTSSTSTTTSTEPPTTTTTSSTTTTTESTTTTSSTSSSTSSSSSTTTTSTTSTSSTTGPVVGCGNGIREGFEACDGDDNVACLGACTATCDCAPPPAKITVAGDSISQGFAADCTSGGFGGALCLLAADKPQYSWFNGTNAAVNSVHKRYLAIDSAVQSQRQSVSGAEMRGGSDNFAAQAGRILTQVPVPDHVEVLLGGNDICNRDCVNPANCGNPVLTDVQWRTAVRAGLAPLVQSLPLGSTVFLLSIPRVHELRDVGLTKPGTTCNTQWSTFSICRIVTNGGTQNGEDYPTRKAGVAERQQRYNEILREEALAYEANSTGQNPRGIEVVVDYVDESTPSVGTTPFLAGDIDAADCFHPSIAGQNKIAEGVWTLNPDRP